MKDDSSQEGIESVCSFDIDCRVSSGRTCSWSQVLGFRERETGKQQHAQLATQSSLHVNKFGTDRRNDGRPPSWLTNILVCKYNIFQTFGSGRGPRVWPFRGEVAGPRCAGFTADSALWVTSLAGGRRFSRCRHGAVCAARRRTDQLQPGLVLPSPPARTIPTSAACLGSVARHPRPDTPPTPTPSNMEPHL